MTSSLKSSLDRFQGCMVGALIGDCLGVPFEGKAFNPGKGITRERITSLINPEHLSTKENGSKRYSDDTAMAKSVTDSLLHCNGFDSVDMATRFTKEFMGNKMRGYGGGIRSIFNTWAEGGINYKNVFTPSIQQFNSTGSYGNGGAMRVAPVALFAKSLEEVVELAKQSAKLTHNHKAGYMGAILQALAVYKALYAWKPINWKEFVGDLKEHMAVLEGVKSTPDVEAEAVPLPVNGTEDDDELDAEDKLSEWTRSSAFLYTKQLEVVDELLTAYHQNKNEDDTLAVITRLGRDISAQEAVPTALYCFLRNLDASFEETLYYTISLGGDTDTIGTMCCAMTGAYDGLSSIPLSWMNVCESFTEIKNMGERMYSLH